MGTISYDINQLERGFPQDPDFPHAPPEWTRDQGMQVAMEEGLKLTKEHWQAIRALQEYFSRHDEESLPIHPRQLHDALDEMFHKEGGIRHLYQIFPGGPIAQGCRVAGLKPPFGTQDLNFGSVS